MRIRKKPYAKKELEASNLYIKKPEEFKGKWNESFVEEQPIYLELGCGRGRFTAKFVKQNPKNNIIAIDLISDMLLYTKRNIEAEFEKEESKPQNVYIFSYDIEQILNVFNTEDKIERIYINFCNPWPKPRHKKRRLTYTKQLEMYKEFLSNNGEIHFKTDDDDLFNESIKYFEDSGFDIIYKTFDLNQDSNQDNILTDHEEMFMKKGIKIKKLIARYKKQKLT